MKWKKSKKNTLQSISKGKGPVLGKIALRKVNNSIRKDLRRKPY